MCILGSRASEDMKASRREMDRAFSCLIIVRSYREELPRAYSNRARINRPVRPYSGHYALTVDCKFPSQPIARHQRNLRLFPSDPPRFGVAPISRQDLSPISSLAALVRA